jgi:hypothetical protein
MVAYGIFNCIWVLTTGKLIYPILKWTDWWTYFYVMGLLIVIVGFHFLLTFISMMKHKDLLDFSRDPHVTYNSTSKTSTVTQNQSSEQQLLMG